MKNLIILAVILMMFCGCSMSQRLIHPTEPERECKVFYYGWMGLLMANAMVNDCVKKSENVGYTKAE